MRVWLWIYWNDWERFTISTHTPVRVWLCYSVKEWRSFDFNSHTREGVTSPFAETITKLKFQLTHPWGCDAQITTYYQQTTKISTHTPVRVWLNVEFFWNHDIEFQLTHPWGCDDCLECDDKPCRISTHTPVRVWHDEDEEEAKPAKISTHTPVRVWLGSEDETIIQRGTFQLTHPWGCD